MNIINDVAKNKINNSNRIAVYTAVTASYDKVKCPKYIDNNIDYYLFGENAIVHDNLWRPNKISFNYRDPRRLAKLYKIFPHLIFPNYDYSIWVDANFEILGNLSLLVDSSMANNYIAFLKHPKRSCLYDESKYVVSLGYDNKNEISNQINRYILDGYPTNNGLISGGFIIRKHNDEKCIKLMEKWWEEIDSYSSRDQLSFNYICWKYNFDYKQIDIQQQNNNFFKINPHPHIKFYTNIGNILINTKTIKAIVLHYISRNNIYKNYLRKYYLKIKNIIKT